MTQPNDVLTVARSQLGYRENSGNRNKYGREYGMDGVPWCSIFMKWCFDHSSAGSTLPGWSAYTPTFADYFKDSGAWGQTASIGAVVFFEWPSMGRIAHVGLVETPEVGGEVSIEGNTDTGGSRTGGSVLRVRRRANIAGYGYPKYTLRSDNGMASLTIAPTSNPRAQHAVIGDNVLPIGSADELKYYVESRLVLAGGPIVWPDNYFNAFLQRMNVLDK